MVAIIKKLASTFLTFIFVISYKGFTIGAKITVGHYPGYYSFGFIVINIKT
jgi:hypothetical protein